MACTDLATSTFAVPFIEQGIQRDGSASLAILAAGYGVVRSHWFIRDRADEFPVEGRDIEIESRGAASERLGDDETGEGLAEHYKSSATTRT
jgi:hypothetical protein